MNKKRLRVKLALVAVLVVTVFGALAAGAEVWRALRALIGPAEPRERLSVELEGSGPYLLLATLRADEDYRGAIARARELHPQAQQSTFDPANVQDALDILKTHRPRYVLVFIEPEELDVNFAWKWLSVTTQVDDDPLVDVRTGFITGAAPKDAEDFVRRIAEAVRGEIEVPGKLIDNLGPNQFSGEHGFYQRRGCFMAPVFGKRVALENIGHGSKAFTDERLSSMMGAGLLHFGGHGYPDGIVDGLRGAQVKRLELSPCVVFNGACYTGVTHRWFEMWGRNGKVSEKEVAPEDCFCLNLLGNQAVGYLAALHPDHGIPVYQEMEFLAYRGASLGEVIKQTHDGVILGFGGKLPAIEPLAAERPSPRWTPGEVMLKGTAARVLFGDPALVVTEAFAAEPFDVSLVESGDDLLQITAALANMDLLSTYTDTYHADLAANKQQFNDRALIIAELPAGWDRVGEVQVVAVEAGGKALEHRLVGHAVEQDGGVYRLHVQVDVPTAGYMKSRFRRLGSRVVLHVQRQVEETR